MPMLCSTQHSKHKYQGPPDTSPTLVTIALCYDCLGSFKNILLSCQNATSKQGFVLSTCFVSFTMQCQQSNSFQAGRNANILFHSYKLYLYIHVHFFFIVLTLLNRDHENKDDKMLCIIS